MVASLNQSPLLTLDALSSCGVVLPTEARAALDTSLTLKARELGVQAFLLWGKFTTSSGRDYYIARAYNGTKRVEGKVIVNPGNKFYYSTDCAEWLDLEPVDGKLGELCGLIDGAFMMDTSVRDMRFIQFPASRASTCTTIVTSSRVTAPGRLRFLPPELNLATRAVKKVANLAHVIYSFPIPTPVRRPSSRHSTLNNNRQAMAHGRPRARVHRHGAAPDAGPGPRDWRRSPDTRPSRTHLGKFICFLIRSRMGNSTDVVLKCLQTELQRMMATINKINSETACAPDGMYVTDAAGNYVAKPGFFVRYPDQLSSYVAPTGNLGKAAPGTW